MWSLRDYDKISSYDEESLLFTDALTEFAEAANSRFFKQTSVILILSHIDVFHEKLKRVPFSRIYSDYSGTSAHDAIMYTIERFQSMMDMKTTSRKLYPVIVSTLGMLL